MDELLSEFLTETAENLSLLDVELIELEQRPNDPGLLGNIFRVVHTIKGTCGFLDLPRLETVAHAAENVLGKFRDGELEVSPDAVTLILASMDRIKLIIGGLEQTESEPEGSDEDLIQSLNAMADGQPVSAPAGPESVAAPDDGAQADAGADEGAEPAWDFPVAAELDDFDDDPRLAEAAPEEGGDEPATETAPQEEVVEAEASTETAAAEPAAQDVPAPTTALVQAKPQPQDVAAPTEARESHVANQSIRVNVELLENLMTMVSELVLTRNQLLQILRSQKDSQFTAPLQRLNHITSELQEGVMKTRMQPIGNAWAKVPRLIRDLSHEMGKRIELEMIGQDTELDRQVLELIKDPLTHMIRNSVDHGIESPEVRAAAGKPEVGRVKLNAFHEGGHIIIEITDDGRGLPVEKIRAKAVTNGLISEAEAAAMTDQQVQQLIFRAGLSTAEKVTNVSGRGVGMDVVRTNIEKIGGTVELKSVEGRGSTFLIKIPLTLAIVSALVIECAGERFAIPQISVVELVRAGGHSEHTIEAINGTPVLRLRSRLLPLVSLRDLLHPGGPAVEQDSSEAFIVVAQVGAYSFGIIVDRVFDTEEIVVKPVAPILRHIDIFSGNTILGDGSVIMILDPNGIAQATGEISVAEGAGAGAEARKHGESVDEVALLLFRGGGSAPKAVPLALVARLEEIEHNRIETSNGQMVVQYRGKLMPLIAFDGGFTTTPEGRSPVLVFADRERSMGLIVDEILDIVQERMSVELTGEGAGAVGSAIIAGKATDVIDAGAYLTQAYSDWFLSHTEAEGTSVEPRRVLLVDDSAFFRNMLTPLLSVAGYNVVSVASAEDAIELFEGGEAFDAVVSDIEMPGMNGFELARKLKADARWGETPIVALSSHTTPRDLSRGREVGFSDYVAKFDRDALLHSLQETLDETRETAGFEP